MARLKFTLSKCCLGLMASACYQKPHIYSGTSLSASTLACNWTSLLLYKLFYLGHYLDLTPLLSLLRFFNTLLSLWNLECCGQI